MINGDIITHSDWTYSYASLSHFVSVEEKEIWGALEIIIQHSLCFNLLCSPLQYVGGISSISDSFKEGVPEPEDAALSSPQGNYRASWAMLASARD